MKTKEQLAEAYAKEKYKKVPPYQDDICLALDEAHLAGYDARTEEINHLKEKLDVFTNREYEARTVEELLEKIRELESREISDGQMFNIANKNAKISELEKLLAESNNSVKALNEKIRELEIDRQAFSNCRDQLSFSRQRIETLELAKEQLLEKIRELEHAASGDNAIIAELNHKLDAANSLIDELDVKLSDIEVMGCYFCASDATEAREKIKEWRNGI